MHLGRRTRSPLSPVASLCALCALAVSAPAMHAAPPDLEDLILRQLSELGDADEAALWEKALALVGLEEATPEENLEETLGSLDASVLPERAQLVVISALLQGSDPSASELHERLAPLLRSDDPVVSTAAAGLYDNDLFRTLGAEPRNELVEELVAGAQDASRDPTWRLRCAVAAHELGRGQHRRQARRELISFLNSSDADLRARGALALAQTGEEIAGPLEDELERVAALPGERGALATAHLKREEIQRWSDRRFRELRERYSETSLPDELAQVDAVLEMVANFHLDGDKVTRDELLDAALDGMLRALDEHSSYLGPETYARFFQDIEAAYGGIGAYVNVDPGDGLFTITRPIYSGPAYEAGLMTDDKIVRIDDWPTLGEAVDDIIKRLKGRPGTDVKLYVWRRGMDGGLIDRPTEEMAVVVQRAQIEIPSVKVDMLPGNVGLIELADFSRVASKEVKRGIEELEAKGMTSLVLDLRRNSGGLLPEAVNVADLFLDPGESVVSTESRVYKPRVHKTRRPAEIDDDLPVTVLIDRYTASAAEIVSGALQDHERATLIGERSFGKGSVQDLIAVDGQSDDDFDDENGNGRFDNWETLTRDLDGDGEFDFAARIKMTIARYLLPSGRSIHRELDEDRNVVSPGGVEPDIAVDQERIDYWRLEEFRRLRGDGVFRDYVNDRWEVDQDAFRELARRDYKDPSRYPDFQQFREGLDTPLSDDDVRYLMRQAVRRRVQDDRGAEFPLGDFQEDRQLQEAIRRNLDEIGDNYDAYEEYASTFEEAPIDRRKPEIRVARSPLMDELNDSRALLLRARDGGGTLSEEELDKILEVLGGIGDDG